MTTKSKAFGDFRTLLTPEAVLRHALEYFETTEEPSKPSKSSLHCTNRGPNGSCCVFGSAIPDDHPAAGLDPTSCATSWLSFHHPEALPNDIHRLWSDMQGVHDGRNWDPNGGLSGDGVNNLESYWNQYLPDVPFPGYNYRGAR
jgi:hypothetical protein